MCKSNVFNHFRYKGLKNPYGTNSIKSFYSNYCIVHPNLTICLKIYSQVNILEKYLR